MDEAIINEICKKVVQQFPLLAGVIPEVRPQPNDIQLLIFNFGGKTSDEKSIPLTIRVTVDQKGNILKTSSSR
jgi:hypothetical protein